MEHTASYYVLYFIYAFFQSLTLIVIKEQNSRDSTTENRLSLFFASLIFAPFFTLYVVVYWVGTEIAEFIDKAF